MGTTLQLLIIQVLLLLVLLFAVIYLLKFNESLKLEKRIGKYTIESINNKPSSLFDALFNMYYKIIKLFSRMLSKSKLLLKYSKKYDKYTDFTDNNAKKAIDFVSNKLFVSLIFLFINFLANIIENQFPSYFEIVLVFVVGFLIPDLLTIYRNHLKKKKIEKDMLNAIIIMNNAFKSGRSTMQAIEIVRDELSGPIKEEFRRMYTEIVYGLSLEVVFQRFTERVDLEEVRYITSSLTILNKTGGNIIKVFSSIEKSLFSKRKLELELKSLTSSSTVMSKILLILPILFTGIILVLNPSYFNPLFVNQIGIFVIIVILLFYVVYAFFVRKLMKVRM
ncbi:MAG: type II secretion system F family protein [Bacilli bacterium]|nr:type II secretion system F family protein [Bacilli bacterium]